MQKRSQLCKGTMLLFSHCHVWLRFDPTDCSLLGSTVHWILQARILEWVAMSFSRGSPQPRNQTQVSCITGRFFISWTMREAQYFCVLGWCKSNCSFCIILICLWHWIRFLNKCGYVIHYFNVCFSLYFFANDLLLAINFVFILD